MAVGASMVTGLMARPKTKAEAGATQAGGEVAISGDAREWAKEFAERARKAEERADTADKRCDEIEAEFTRFRTSVIHHVRELRQEITNLGGHPPPPPPEL